jgi:cell division protein FtsN
MSGDMASNKAVLAGLLALTVMLSACSRQQSDWEKSRSANTTDAYELFLKKYPSGEFSAQAKARLNELYEEADWKKARDADTPDAYQAFLKQYPEGKWTEEARIRVENFTLAQSPNGAAENGTTAGAENGATTPPDASTPPPTAGPPAAKTFPAPPPVVQHTPPAKPAKPAAVAAAVPAPKPAAAAKPATTASSGTGAFGVQLGAFKSSSDAANKRWAELQKGYPKLFAGLSPKISSKTGSAGTLYRLQVANLSEKHAREICESLQASSQACVLVPPTHG